MLVVPYSSLGQEIQDEVTKGSDFQGSLKVLFLGLRCLQKNQMLLYTGLTFSQGSPPFLVWDAQPLCFTIPFYAWAGSSAVLSTCL